MKNILKKHASFELKHHPVTLFVTFLSILFFLVNSFLKVEWFQNPNVITWILFNPLLSINDFSFFLLSLFIFWYISKNLESYLGSVALFNRIMWLSLSTGFIYILAMDTTHNNGLFTLIYSFLTMTLTSHLFQRKTMPNAEIMFFHLVIILMIVCLFFLPTFMLAISLIAILNGFLLGFFLKPAQHNFQYAPTGKIIIRSLGWTSLAFLLIFILDGNSSFGFSENTVTSKEAITKTQTNPPEQTMEAKLIAKKKAQESKRLAERKKQIEQKKQNALRIAKQKADALAKKKKQEQLKQATILKKKQYLNQKISINKNWYSSHTGKIFIKKVTAKRNLNQKLMRLNVELTLTARTKVPFEVADAQYTVYYDELKTGLGSIKGDVSHISKIKGGSSQPYNIVFYVPRDIQRVKLIFFNDSYTKQTSLSVKF